MFEAGKKTHDTDDSFSKDNSIEQILEIALKREFKAKTRYENMAGTTIQNLKQFFQN